MSDLLKFLRLEAIAGLALIAAAAIAIVLANSPVAESYNGLLAATVEVRFGEASLAKPLLLWINDGLMAVFFLLIGLELKREVLEGELSNLRQIALPLAGAIGGIAVPVLLFVLINRGSEESMRGWAIPSATDIAFALGMLAMLGPRVPAALKTFLMTVAVFDDIAAIIIIAIFYTGEIQFQHGLGLGAIALLVLLNRFKVTRLGPYLIVGTVLWFAVLKSGVHATLAGVIVGFAIPLRARNAHGLSPLLSLEHALHPYVAFLILPLFAFANAGVSLAGVSADALLAPMTLGVAVGLLVGKPVGVFLFSFLLVKTGLVRLPEGLTWRSLFGAAILAGIGFTMSLFIGTLAFEGDDAGLQSYGVAIRLGVLGASVAAAALGLTYLRLVLPKPEGDG